MNSQESKEAAGLVARKDPDDSRAMTVVHDDGPFASYLDTGRFMQIQRVAMVFADCDVIPTNFQKNVGSCFVITQLAIRLGVDPFMLFQSMMVIHGKPGMEARLCIALANERGPFTGPIQYEFSGTKGQDDWTCTAIAKHKETGEVYKLPINWATVKAEGWLDKSGSKWKTMPEQMFRYRSASWLIRAYCPEVVLGIHTIDELEDAAPAINYVKTEIVADESAMSTLSPDEKKIQDNLANARASGLLDDEPADPVVEPKPEPKPKQRRGKNKLIDAYQVADLFTAVKKLKPESKPEDVVTYCNDVLDGDIGSLDLLTVGELESVLEHIEQDKEAAE